MVLGLIVCQLFPVLFIIPLLYYPLMVFERATIELLSAER